MVSADVFAPPTTSTSGIRCGGLKGCPVTQRSGCLHSDWMRLIGIPEVLDTRMAGGGRIESMSANNLILRGSRSGAFSCTRSASAMASFRSDSNRRREVDAPGASPIFVSAAHAASTYWRILSTDPAPGTEDKMRQYVEAAWAALTKIGLAPGASTARLRFTADLKEAVADADLVQENAPEREAVKIKLFAEMDSILPPPAILASVEL